MLFFLLLLPLALGLLGYYLSKGKITWKELLVLEAVVCVFVGGGYAAALSNRTADFEHWNGRVAEKRTESVTCCHDYCCAYGTCGSGKNTYTCCTMYCKRHSHDIEWSVITTNKETVFDDGCNSPGSSPPKRWVIAEVGEPTSVEHSFTNYVKGNPDTILKRTGVTEKWKKYLPKYPEVYDYYRSHKFIDIGGVFHDPHDTDMMNDSINNLNAELGASKQVNITVVAVKTDDQEFGEALEEHWIGSKKNDLVIVLGMQDGSRINWARVISWSRSEEMKITIRDKSIGPFAPAFFFEMVKEEVSKGWKQRNWHDFDYLRSTVEPTGTVTAFLFVLGFVVCVSLQIYFWTNDPFEDERFFRDAEQRRQFHDRMKGKRPWT